jgi:hypothetical protein
VSPSGVRRRPGLQPVRKIHQERLSVTTAERPEIAVISGLTTTSNGEAPRPAYQMFKGHVTMTGGGWEPWVRALHPDQVDLVARDLSTITGREAERRFRELASHRSDPEEDVDYACHYLRRAQEFIGSLTTAGRGMVYMIR